MQILSSKKKPQNALKHGFGRVLGSIWEGFGTFWSVFWALLGAFSPFFCFNHGSKMVSKRPFGLILGRFWRVLGAFWEHFRRVWLVFGLILKGSGRVWLTLFKFFYVRAPALSREAPRSVPMRGGPTPPRVE